MAEMTHAEAGPGPGAGWRGDLIAAVVCVAVGLLLSTLPHLLDLRAFGSTVYVADYDELGVYLPLGSQAYFDHPTYLTDAARAEGGRSHYPALQLLPGVLMARALHWGPMGLGLAWRIWAGLTIALAWYFLARQYFARPGIAAAAAIFLMADVGQLSANVLVKQFSTALRLAAGRPGTLFDTFPVIHTQWRIMTPGLSLACLLVFFGLLARARSRPTWTRIAAAGLGFGLLFYDYFYYWTAVGMGLVLALALDAGYRRVYFHAGWIGGLAGLPKVVSEMMGEPSDSPEHLARMDLFVHVSRLESPLIAKAGLVLLAVGLVWAWRWRRDLIPLWCVAASAMFLMNHQVVTGLQLQNFHWFFVWGPCLSLMVVLSVARMVADRGPSRLVAWGIVALLGVHLALGVWLREQEALRTRQSREILATYRAYRAQRAPAPALASNAVVAGDPAFVDQAVISENLRPLDHYSVQLSSRVNDAEWDERIALNGYLRGLDRQEFEAAQRKLIGELIWGYEARSPLKRSERLASRMAAFDRAGADLPAALDRYRVRYVALPSGRRPAYLDAGWRNLQAGASWDLWERTAEAAPRGTGTGQAGTPPMGGDA